MWKKPLHYIHTTYIGRLKFNLWSAERDLILKHQSPSLMLPDLTENQEDTTEFSIKRKRVDLVVIARIIGTGENV